MQPIEIIVIVISILIVLAVLGVHIYKKKKGLPTGECAQCAKGSKYLLKKYKKMYKNKK